MSDLPTDRRFIGAVEGVPASPSPISNAVVVGDTCWISGQLSGGDDGRYRPGTASEEAERAFELVFRMAASYMLIPNVRRKLCCPAGVMATVRDNLGVPTEGRADRRRTRTVRRLGHIGS